MQWDTTSHQSESHHQKNYNKCWRWCRKKGNTPTMLEGMPLWKTLWSFLKKVKVELLYDPSISLMALYLEETLI